MDELCFIEMALACSCLSPTKSGFTKKSMQVLQREASEFMTKHFDETLVLSSCAAQNHGILEVL